MDAPENPLVDEYQTSHHSPILATNALLTQDWNYRWGARQPRMGCCSGIAAAGGSVVVISLLMVPFLPLRLLAYSGLRSHHQPT